MLVLTTSFRNVALAYPRIEPVASEFEAVDRLYPLLARDHSMEPTTEFVGTPDRDRIRGSRGADYIDVNQGGNDSVACHENNDTVYFGPAYTPRDRVNGGKGIDTVILDGDYSAGLEITERSLHSIDSLELRGGSYVITGILGFKGIFGETVIDAGQLGANQTLDLNIETLHDLRVLGGRGDDVLRAAHESNHNWLDGLSGDDILIGGGGASLLLGNDGADQIVMVSAGDVAAYFSSLESVLGSVDRIDNFAASGGRIELDFDSDTKTPGNQFDFHLGRTADRVGDILFHHDAAHDFTIVKVFTDPDNQADLILHLTGDVPLTPADFIFG